MAGRLTAAIVRALNEPGMYGDGQTLYLRIGPSGSKSWVQRMAIKGKRHDLGLGGYPLVSLAEARETAFENRRLAQKAAIRWPRSAEPRCRPFGRRPRRRYGHIATLAQPGYGAELVAIIGAPCLSDHRR